MSKRILVIDDLDHMRLMLKLTLELHGYDVIEANQGLAALELLQADKADLIFCDVDMPVLNGVEFVRRFRAEYGPETPIIMLSAENNDTLKATLAAGATATVSKPFEPMQLLAMLEKML